MGRDGRGQRRMRFMALGIVGAIQPVCDCKPPVTDVIPLDSVRCTQPDHAETIATTSRYRSMGPGPPPGVHGTGRLATIIGALPFKSSKVFHLYCKNGQKLTRFRSLALAWSPRRHARPAPTRLTRLHAQIQFRRKRFLWHSLPAFQFSLPILNTQHRPFHDRTIAHIRPRLDST